MKALSPPRSPNIWSADTTWSIIGTASSSVFQTRASQRDSPGSLGSETRESLENGSSGSPGARVQPRSSISPPFVSQAPFDEDDGAYLFKCREELDMERKKIEEEIARKEKRKLDDQVAHNNRLRSDARLLQHEADRWRGLYLQSEQEQQLAAALQENMDSEIDKARQRELELEHVAESLRLQHASVESASQCREGEARQQLQEFEEERNRFSQEQERFRFLELRTAELEGFLATSNNSRMSSEQSHQLCLQELRAAEQRSEMLEKHAAGLQDALVAAQSKQTNEYKMRVDGSQALYLAEERSAALQIRLARLEGEAAVDKRKHEEDVLLVKSEYGQVLRDARGRTECLEIRAESFEETLKSAQAQYAEDIQREHLGHVDARAKLERQCASLVRRVADLEDRLVEVAARQKKELTNERNSFTGVLHEKEKSAKAVESWAVGLEHSLAAASAREKELCVDVASWRARCEHLETVNRKLRCDLHVAIEQAREDASPKPPAWPSPTRPGTARQLKEELALSPIKQAREDASPEPPARPSPTRPGTARQLKEELALSPIEQAREDSSPKPAILPSPTRPSTASHLKKQLSWSPMLEEGIQQTVDRYCCR